MIRSLLSTLTVLAALTSACGPQEPVGDPVAEGEASLSEEDSSDAASVKLNGPGSNVRDGQACRPQDRDRLACISSFVYAVCIQTPKGLRWISRNTCLQDPNDRGQCVFHPETHYGYCKYKPRKPGDGFVE
jgi:hypothetical protein